jgi:hypothetical protein
MNNQAMQALWQVHAGMYHSNCTAAWQQARYLITAAWPLFVLRQY